MTDVPFSRSTSFAFGSFFYPFLKMALSRLGGVLRRNLFTSVNQGTKQYGIEGSVSATSGHKGKS